MVFRLAKPTLSMEQEYNDYIAEWESTGEMIVPYASRRNGEDYSSLLARWEIDSTEKAFDNGLVPATILFMTNEVGKIFGIIHIRHELNDYLFMLGGHIGFRRVLITCDKNNFASARTIIANGGIFENEIPGEDITQSYWIEI